MKLCIRINIYKRFKFLNGFFTLKDPSNVNFKTFRSTLKEYQIGNWCNAI